MQRINDSSPTISRRNTVDGILRPLSVLEEYARSFGIVVSRNRIRGKLSIANLRQALQVMTQRHPFLNAALYDSRDGSYYRRQRDLPIPLTIREEVRSEEERNRLYEEELNTPLNYYKQLWRILVVLDGTVDEIDTTSRIDLILTLQHVICDGLSIQNLAKEILEQTQALQQGKPLYENQILPVMPPMDQYLPRIIHNSSPAKGTRLFLTPRDQTLKMEEINYGSIDVLDRDLSVPKNQCRVRYFNGQYSVRELQSLWRHCKRMNISIHGVVAACMIKALSECVTTPAGRATNLLLRNPIDMRIKAAPDRGGIGNQHLLNFVISELVLCSVEETATIPELSHQFIKKLNNKIKNQQAIKRYQATANSGEFTEINKERAAQILLISNIGRIDTRADYGGFELLETNYIPSKKSFALQFSLTSFAGYLNYILLYTSPWYKTELIADLHQRFREHLKILTTHSGGHSSSSLPG